MFILSPILAIGGMGLIFGALLSIAAKIFAVEKDERIPLITEYLPGANCGGCGFAGCSAAAEAIVKGEAQVNCCPVGGNEAAEKIAEIMGVVAEKTERMTAFVMCSGSSDAAKTKYDNNECIDCHTAARLGGGLKECSFACLGLGSCVKKCMYGALSIENGVAVVACSSKDKGKDTRNACDAGCIGCGICAKNCEAEAITVVDNCAVIDYAKCTGCGLCQEKCPRAAIKIFGQKPEVQTV